MSRKLTDSFTFPKVCTDSPRTSFGLPLRQWSLMPRAAPGGELSPASLHHVPPALTLGA